MKEQTKSDVNRVDPRSKSPVANEAIASIYPLELVADIASKVLNGTDYSNAAKIAVALLDACQKELTQQTHKRTIVYTAKVKRKAKYAAIERDHHKNFVIKSFKEALRIITGEVREERAFSKYKRFLSHQIRQSIATDKVLDLDDVAAPSVEKVEDAIKYYKAEGMRHDVALMQKEAFETWEPKDASNIARQKALKKSPRKK